MYPSAVILSLHYIILYIFFIYLFCFVLHLSQFWGLYNVWFDFTAWLSENLVYLMLFWRSWLSAFLEKLVTLRYIFFHLLTSMYFPLLPSLSIVLMKTGRSLSFRPAVSHLLCAGFTEIWNIVEHLIQARYETFCNEDNSGEDSKNGDAQDNSQIDDSFLEKDLEAALDSFDNLFCRRCRVRFFPHEGTE